MGIDRLRLDKFMMLTRKFVHSTFALMLRYACQLPLSACLACSLLTCEAVQEQRSARAAGACAGGAAGGARRDSLVWDVTPHRRRAAGGAAARSRAQAHPSWRFPGGAAARGAGHAPCHSGPVTPPQVCTVACRLHWGAYARLDHWYAVQAGRAGPPAAAGCRASALAVRLWQAGRPPLRARSVGRPGVCCSAAGQADVQHVAGAEASTTGRVRAVMYELSEAFRQSHKERCASGAFDSAAPQSGVHAAQRCRLSALI